MTKKYGVRTRWWKHLKEYKKFHWKSVRQLFKKKIKKLMNSNNNSKE